jgi:hypothetical protein
MQLPKSSMVRNRFQITFLIILLTLSFEGFAQSVHGVFKVVKGDVTVVTSDGKKEKAKLGMKVFPKDRIRTAKDARAKVVMVDNNELNITPETEIVIEDYKFNPEENKKNVIINVMYGKLRAKVEQKYDDDNKFQVKTKSAVAGVRGTDFFTSYARANNETRVVTFEGRVEFGSIGSQGRIENAVFVGPGQMSALTTGALPSRPSEVPRDELSRLNDASRSDRSPASAGSGFTTMQDADLAGRDVATSDPVTMPDQSVPAAPTSCPPQCGPQVPLEDFINTPDFRGRNLIIDVKNPNP